MPRRRALLVLLLAALPAAVAGCFGGSETPVEVVPYLPLVDAAPDRPVAVAFFVRSTDAFKQRVAVGVEGLPPGWSFEPAQDALELPGRASTALVAHVRPAADARHGVHEVRVLVGDVGGRIILNVRDAPAQTAEPNGSATLEFVSWNEAGEIVASNVPALRNQSHIPNASRENASMPVPDPSAPLVAFLGPPPAPDGLATLPRPWLDALLPGARPGDVRFVEMTTQLDPRATTGTLLHVLDVAPPPNA